MIKQLFLAHRSCRPEKVLSAVILARQPAFGAFLCQSYPELLNWQEVLGTHLRWLNIGEALLQSALRLRTAFLERLTALGRQYNSVAWWTSRISERNTAVSPLFLYCCYLQLGQEMLKEYSGSLYVVGESWGMLDALADYASKQGIEVRWLSRPWPGYHQITPLMLFGLRLVKFIYRSLLHIARLPMRPAKDGQSSVLLRTWVDDACFGEDHVFYDRYLPGLSDWLEARGIAVTTLPVIFNVRRSKHAVREWMRHSQHQFLNPYQYYRLLDYVFAMREAGRQSRMLLGNVHLGELDVTRLFESERERTTFDVGTLEAILSYRLPLRLAQSNIRVDIFIDEFENMIPEKPLILGFRRYLPNTRLVGFQHGALYPMLLCNFITPGEADFAPMPDRVVCNGEFFREVLVQEGLPPDRAVAGPALRYTHLWQLADAPLSARGDEVSILVPLPLVLSEAVELLVKVISALAPLTNVRVWLKPHPMAPPNTLLRAAHLPRLPSRFEFVGGGMKEWLARAHLVVAMSSSTVYESLAAGIPLIVVGRETALALNPLAWHPDYSRVFYTPEEIRAEALRWLALPTDDLERYLQKTREILRRSFGRMTDQAMQVFIEGLLLPDLLSGDKTAVVTRSSASVPESALL